MKQRKLKFRAWNHKLRTMFYDVCIGMNGNPIDGASFLSYDKKKDAVMQAVGLKDMKRKEIYEGDILMIAMRDGKGTVYENFQVLWSKRELRWLLKDKNKETWAFTAKNDIKVIGNIYETPFYLKKKK